jgi:multiphosphoryl transfer protein
VNEVVLHAPFAGWLTALEDVPDPVFAERMMGDGLAIDPIENVLRAPADGVVVSIPDSGHAVTLRLINEVELLIHIGLETVGLGGAGFRALVRAGDAVRRGDSLIEFDLDRVARGAKDLITPVVAATDGAVLAGVTPGRRVAAGDRIATVSGLGGAEARAEGQGSATGTISVIAPNGIHARPAARIAMLLKGYAADVVVHNDTRRADARSTVALLALGAQYGDELRVEASGRDAQAALSALTAFAAERFGDAEGAPAAAAPPPTRESGICAAPGLAIGQVLQLRAVERDVPRIGAGVAEERRQLDRALHEVGAGLEAGGIADAHRALLEDPALVAAAQARIAEGLSAGFAWRQASRDAADAIRDTGNPLLMERIDDLRDVEGQIIAALLGEPAVAVPSIAPGTVLVAQDLFPSQFQALDHAHLAGICLAAGGPTAHVAILAASAGVPMVVAAGPAVLAIPDGRTVVLDADGGRLDPEPDDERLASVEAQIADRRRQKAAAAASAHEDCRMADGTRIEIFANLGSADDAAVAVAAGAEGCGLLRTEFLFLDRTDAPDEDEQAALYRQIAGVLGDRPLIVRTLDIGGDKPVPYLPKMIEENPALGLRGIRLGLARPDLLMTQLRAILRAVPAAQCRIMLPMIIDRDELSAVRAMLDEARHQLGRTEPVQLGVMIETPSAAMLADQIAGEADFLSVGTNDLTQYALACDRTNAAVSAKIDALHPAVLRLIGQAAQGAAVHGRWTGVCGGLASDPLAAPVLIGLGVTELSATPAMVPTLKAAVRRLDMQTCTGLARRALDATSPAQVRAILSEQVA